MGNITHLKLRPKICGDCEQALLGSSGVYCRLYQEDIWDERVAEECENFEPTSGLGQVIRPERKIK